MKPEAEKPKIQNPKSKIRNPKPQTLKAQVMTFEFDVEPMPVLVAVLQPVKVIVDRNLVEKIVEKMKEL
jgi:hypothetical protein